MPPRKLVSRGLYIFFAKSQTSMFWPALHTLQASICHSGQLVARKGCSHAFCTALCAQRCPGGAVLPPCIQAIALASQAASGHSKPVTRHTASADPALPARRKSTRKTTALHAPLPPAPCAFHIHIPNATPPPFPAMRQSCPGNPACCGGLYPVHEEAIPGQCGCRACCLLYTHTRPVPVLFSRPCSIL